MDTSTVTCSCIVDVPLFESEIEWNCDLFSSGNVVQSVHTKVKLIGNKEMTQLKEVCRVYVHLMIVYVCGYCT